MLVVGTLGTRWYLSPDRMSIRSTIQRARLVVDETLRPGVGSRDVNDVRRLARYDEWTTYAHDDRRSGFERKPTGITRATVSSLRRRWMRPLKERVRASPLVAGGTVYIASEEGTVFALDAASGDVRWVRDVGTSVRMTPALVNGALLVGVYGALGEPGKKPSKAAFVSLNAATGAVRWRTELPGLVRSEPVVIDGVIYEGLAGGDKFSGCFDGRIIALSEKTGALLPFRWRTSDRSENGGGIWGPLSTDGTSIYAGTGNTCDEAVGYGDSIVALSPSLRLRWHASARVPGVEDSDVGGGVVLDGERAHVAGKSGYLYDLDTRSGEIVRRIDLAPWARNGGSIGTPTGDGTVLVVSGGEKSDPARPSAPGCVITAFDKAGRALYHMETDNPVTGYAAFVPGVGFIVLDRRLVAFDARTGEVLWDSPLGDLGYASPVVVPSGLYAVNNVGDVFAFELDDRRAAMAENERLQGETVPRGNRHDGDKRADVGHARS
jgi:outer membrane protein assembly factor BamB